MRMIANPYSIDMQTDVFKNKGIKRIKGSGFLEGTITTEFCKITSSYLCGEYDVTDTTTHTTTTLTA